MLKKTAALSSSTDRVTTSNSVTEIEEFIFKSADFGNLDFYDKKKKKQSIEYLSTQMENIF